MSIKYFVPFLIELFVFLLLGFEISLYILHRSPLLGVSFADIFSSLWLTFSFP